MTHSEPTPPPELPTDLVDTLGGYSPEDLNRLARYAEALAEYKARERRLAEASETDETPEQRPETPPDDVPSKATLTVKEINGNRYYYWQWREGDKIKSKYERPVGQDE